MRRPFLSVRDGGRGCRPEQGRIATEGSFVDRVRTARCPFAAL